MRAQAQEAMRAAVGELLEPDPENEGKRRIRPELWPDPDFVDVGVRGDASELADARTLDPVDRGGRPWRRRSSSTPSPPSWTGGWSRTSGSSCSARTCTDSPAARTARRRGSPRGSPIACWARRSARTRSPVSAGGLALDGRFRPVVEFMYPDFMWVAADQVFNQIGKARHMFGGVNPVPLVLRTKVAMGSGYGSQHLMDPAGIFATSPGWRIVAPSTAADYVGLMNAALALRRPGARDRARRPVRPRRRDPRRRPRLPAAVRQGRPAPRGGAT